MPYAATKFKVARSNGLGGDTFTRNVTDARKHIRTDGRRDGRRTDFGTRLIYPFSKEKNRYNNNNLIRAATMCHFDTNRLRQAKEASSPNVVQSVA